MFPSYIFLSLFFILLSTLWKGQHSLKTVMDVFTILLWVVFVSFLLPHSSSHPPSHFLYSRDFLYSHDSFCLLFSSLLPFFTNFSSPFSFPSSSILSSLHPLWAWIWCLYPFFLRSTSLCPGIHTVQTVNLQVEYGESTILPCNGSAYLEEERSVQWEAMGDDVAILWGGELRQGDKFKVSAVCLLFTLWNQQSI